MQKYLTTTSFSQDQQWLRDHGDSVWEIICDAMPTGLWFRPEQLAEDLRYHGFRASEKNLIRYVTLVLRNVQAQHAVDETQSPVERAGHRWRLR